MYQLLGRERFGLITFFPITCLNGGDYQVASDYLKQRRGVEFVDIPGYPAYKNVVIKKTRPQLDLPLSFRGVVQDSTCSQRVSYRVDTSLN